MWKIHQTSQHSHSRPSVLIGIQDPWAAYQFDSAVALFGLTIENAASEQEKIGEGKTQRWVKKYALADLLTPGFRIARPPTEEERDRAGLAAFAGLAGVRTIKVQDKVQDG